MHYIYDYVISKLGTVLSLRLEKIEEGKFNLQKEIRSG